MTGFPRRWTLRDGLRSDLALYITGNWGIIGHWRSKLHFFFFIHSRNLPLGRLGLRNRILGCGDMLDIALGSLLALLNLLRISWYDRTNQ